jgi:hypothetical protein
MTVLRGSQLEQGESMAEMVECPCCRGGGCVVCHGWGRVKRANLDRARDGWDPEALNRLTVMVEQDDDGPDWEWLAANPGG